MILAEGHKIGPYPKIIVHRPEVGDPPELVDPIIATVGSLTREGVPSFDHEDIAGIADFIALGWGRHPGRNKGRRGRMVL